MPHPSSARALCDQSRAHWTPLFQNPRSATALTTNDDYSCHRNSAACYQLAQSVLKIGSVLAERVGQGEVGGCTALADSAWRLLQLAGGGGWVHRFG